MAVNSPNLLINNFLHIQESKKTLQGRLTQRDPQTKTL